MVLAASLALGASMLAACGSDSGPPVLTWYINPDNGGQAELAKKCTDAAGGKYTINTSILPNDATAQREQLVRRLAASDSSITMMSLDPPFIPEFSEAGFLKPPPQQDAAEFTDGVVQSAVKSATWKDQLVAVPFWANTQLLWYRKSVAKKAGLNMDQPVTWDQLIKAAKQTNTTVGVQANRYEGYTVWINALISGAGGKVIDNPEAPADEVKTGLETPAGKETATIIREVADTGVGGPGLSTMDEEGARLQFQSDHGGFMINWPYVWQAAQSEVKGGTLDKSYLTDLGWTEYPRTDQDKPAAPPFGGIELAVGAFTDHASQAFDAVKCITSKQSQTEYMLSSGNPAALKSVYDDPQVKKAFPMASLIVQSLDKAVPRPQTPYYGEVSGSLQRTFHPASSVSPDRTPVEANDLIVGVLRKEQLL